MHNMHSFSLFERRRYCIYASHFLSGIDIKEDSAEQKARKKVPVTLFMPGAPEVCAWPPDPGDLPEPGKRLKAVNGSKLNCYGYKEVT